MLQILLVILISFRNFLINKTDTTVIQKFTRKDTTCDLE